jgi:hypothetical protein
MRRERSEQLGARGKSVRDGLGVGQAADSGEVHARDNDVEAPSIVVQRQTITHPELPIRHGSNGRGLVTVADLRQIRTAEQQLRHTRSVADYSCGVGLNAHRGAN